MDIITAAYNLKIRKLVEYCSVEFAGLMQDWYTSQGRDETEIMNKFASHNGHSENPIMQHLNEFLGAEIEKNHNVGQKQSKATVDRDGLKFQNSRVNILNGQKHKTLKYVLNPKDIQSMATAAMTGSKMNPNHQKEIAKNLADMANKFANGLDPDATLLPNLGSPKSSKKGQNKGLNAMSTIMQGMASFCGAVNKNESQTPSIEIEEEFSAESVTHTSQGMTHTQTTVTAGHMNMQHTSTSISHTQ